MKVVVYSTEICPYCVMVKNYLKKNNVSFYEYDIGTDNEKSQEMIKISGQTGVPVITIDEKVIIGFDKPAIDNMLGLT